jgi:histidinol dehydrogenase
MSLKRIDATSRRGRRAIERLLERGGDRLDRKLARVQRRARRIVDAVRAGGDRELLRAVDRYDGVPARRVTELRRRPTRLPAQDLPPGFEHAIERALRAVERFHRAQHDNGPRGFELGADGLGDVAGGARIVERCEPLRRVCLYVPGGRFPYPSTVAMSVIPARLAGVKEIVVATPPRAFETSPALRHTLALLQVDEVWAMGGAHAIAAMAYGTETIAAVEMIAGPGNAYVSAAKQAVAGRVGIDQDAGPSEVVILASEDVGEGAVSLIAADLLAQAEHDPRAVVVAITPDRKLLRAIAAEVDHQLRGLPTAETARAALAGASCGLLVEDLEAGLALAERLAPEHMQLVGPAAEELASRVRSAGAVFVGAATPTAFGDYLAGPSHVLPTGGTARFASGLSTSDFVRRWHVVRYDAAAAAAAAGDVAALARAEGLIGHAASAERRALPSSDLKTGGDRR